MNTMPISEAQGAIHKAIILIFAASSVIIAAAWGFEIIGGYDPCPLCLQERWAYYFAIVMSPLAFLAYNATRPNLTIIILGLVAIGYLINSGVGIYHAGVEWKFWAGPSACTGTGNDGSGNMSIIEKIQSTKFPRCDEAPWTFLGISFAGYNAIFSAGLSAIAFWTAYTIHKSNPFK